MIFYSRHFKDEPEINIVNNENVDHDIKVEEDLKWVNYLIISLIIIHNPYIIKTYNIYFYILFNVHFSKWKYCLEISKNSRQQNYYYNPDDSILKF